MRLARIILAVAAPGAIATALVACSSAPDEATQSSGSQLVGSLVNAACPIGQTPSCKTVLGRSVCTCVFTAAAPPPLQCTFPPPVTPAGAGSWIAAWAVLGDPASCPSIVTPTGTWKEIVPPPFRYVGPGSTPPEPTLGSNGVPNDPWPATPDCQVAFPGAQCCTYVWWPLDGNDQATGALCTVSNLTLEPLTEGPFQVCPPDANEDGGPRCIDHHGSSCSTCLAPCSTCQTE